MLGFLCYDDVCFVVAYGCFLFPYGSEEVVGVVLLLGVLFEEDPLSLVAYGDDGECVCVADLALGLFV